MSRRARTSRRMSPRGLMSPPMNLLAPTSPPMSPRGLTSLLMSRLMSQPEPMSQLTSRRVTRLTVAMDRTPRMVEVAGTEVTEGMEMVGMEAMEAMTDLAATEGTTDLVAPMSLGQRISPPSPMPARGFFPSGLTGCNGFLTWEKGILSAQGWLMRLS